MAVFSRPENVPRNAHARRDVLVGWILIKLSVTGAGLGTIGTMRGIAAIDIHRHSGELVAEPRIHREPWMNLEVILQVRRKQSESPITIQRAVGCQSDESRRPVLKEARKIVERELTE